MGYKRYLFGVSVVLIICAFYLLYPPWRLLGL